MNNTMLDSAFERMVPQGLGNESVTFTPVTVVSNVTTVGTPVTGVQAYRRKERDRTAPAGGTVMASADETTWILRDSNLSGGIPKINDLITDADSVVWLVKAVSRDGMDSRWVCQCARKK